MQPVSIWAGSDSRNLPVSHHLLQVQRYISFRNDLEMCFLFIGPESHYCLPLSLTPVAEPLWCNSGLLNMPAKNQQLQVYTNT